MQKPPSPSPSSKVPQLTSIDAEPKGASRGINSDTPASSIQDASSLVSPGRLPLHGRVSWPEKPKKQKRHRFWSGCLFCSQRGHAAAYCEKFDVESRWAAVERRKWCSICLMSGHLFDNCRAKTRKNACRFCSGMHHPALCRDKWGPQDNVIAPKKPREEANDEKPDDPMEEGVDEENHPKTGNPKTEENDVSDMDSEESDARKPRTYGIYDVHIDLDGSEDDDQ